MRPPEAFALAERIAQTWPTMRIPTRLWADRLVELDEGTAGTAYIRLVDSESRPPTIATFVSAYRDLSTAWNEPVERCATCGGDGMFSRWQEWGGRATEVVDACPDCARGERMRQPLRAVVEYNSTTLDRLFPDRNREWTLLLAPPELPQRIEPPAAEPETW